jgi:hypothetical protein
MRHVPPGGALDPVFAQVIDGLGRRPGVVAPDTAKADSLTAVNCLTLMPMVIVKFLTLINGHAR